MWKEITGIFSGPVRRRLSPEDEFFDDGNVQRALLCKISVFVLLEQGRRGEEDTVDIGTEEDNQPVLKCTFPNCSATFSSLKRLEAHFETSHRNRCATCERSFPSHRLLDIHLSEEHDSFFKAMAERNPMYMCLVEGCKETFWSTGKRHVHLVETHRYPKNFDFSRQSFSRTKKNRRVSTKCPPKHPRRKQERHHTEVGAVWSDELSTVSAMETEGKSPAPGGHRGTAVGGFEAAHDTNGSLAAAKDGDMEVEDADDKRPSISKCHEDRTAGQNPRLSRRCKYWRTSKGCRAGSECRFRHDADRPPGAEEGELNGAEQQLVVGQEGLGSADGLEGRRNAEHQGDRMDTTDVDELVEGMKTVSIPANLSFGRAARRGRPIHRFKR